MKYSGMTLYNVDQIIGQITTSGFMRNIIEVLQHGASEDDRGKYIGWERGLGVNPNEPLADCYSECWCESITPFI